jgi:Beta-ketoacyl synthase, N-terminal domain
MTGGPPGPEPEVEPEVAAVPTPSLATEVAVPLDERIEAIEDEIVVVGMGIAVPGASDPAQFWHELPQGDERLNADGIPCPSAHDPRRNPHRKADGWQAATIRAILGTRVTPAAGCGAGSTESTGSSTRPTPARHGRALRGQLPDTSPWRPAVR